MNTVASKIYIVVFALLVGSAGGGLILLIKTNNELTQKNTRLEDALSSTESSLASTTQKLRITENDLATTRSILNAVSGERSILQQNLESEKAKVGPLEEQVGVITGAVGELIKLKSLDPELLKKYSRVFFLNEHYIPKKLSQIKQEFIYPGRGMLFHSDAMPFLENMLNDARDDGIDILIQSAYRTFGEQGTVKYGFTLTYGTGANAFSADQGYSEHQLGTAVDFTTKSTGADFDAFKDTVAYDWLTKNAFRYGFLLSYSEKNTFYQFEPWHWRFVGRVLAQKLYSENLQFYSMDQREIDSFLIQIFDL